MISRATQTTPPPSKQEPPELEEVPPPQIHAEVSRVGHLATMAITYDGIDLTKVNLTATLSLSPMRPEN
jgi:hypothetical protein